MPYTDLFNCEDTSMAGIKTLKLATRDTNGNPLTFPLNFQLKTNDESTIILQENIVNNYFTIGGVNISYRNVFASFANFVEDEISDRQGRYYKKTLDFNLPQLNIITNNQLKDFLFTTSGEFAISNAVAFVTDLNNNNWIIGYDIPLILDKLDLTTDTREGDNQYSLSYISNSYNRTRKYEVT